MSPRTRSGAPLDDRSYWLLLLLATVHPDREGGDGELFVFLTELREHVEGCLSARGQDRSHVPSGATRRPTDAERVCYVPALGHADEFLVLTMRALSIGQRAEEPHRSLLGLLSDCPVREHGRSAFRQGCGATYKQLAFAAHLAGLSKDKRCRLYEQARAIPLSERTSITC